MVASSGHRSSCLSPWNSVGHRSNHRPSHLLQVKDQTQGQHDRIIPNKHVVQNHLLFLSESIGNRFEIVLSKAFL